jgi:hypothetical protein
MSRLTAKVAPPPDPTMDFAMTERARARRIPIDALESWSAQLTALADAVTIEDLRETLRERATIQCTLADLLGTYRTGDLAAMTPRLVVRGSEKLLDARNRLWLPKLERYFATGGAFVAVGLGHMLGSAGLPALLSAAGYRVERVRPRPPTRPPTPTARTTVGRGSSGRVALHVEQRDEDRGEGQQALSGGATGTRDRGLGGGRGACRRDEGEEEGNATHESRYSKRRAALGRSPTVVGVSGRHTGHGPRVGCAAAGSGPASAGCPIDASDGCHRQLGSPGP